MKELTKVNPNRKDKVTEGQMEITDHKEEHQEIVNHQTWLTQPPGWNKETKCLTELTQVYLPENGGSDTAFCHSNSFLTPCTGLF